MLAIAGISLILLVLFDIFQSIIVPRFTPRTLRLAPLLIGEILWPNFRMFALKRKNRELRDFLLGSFGSAAFLFLIVCWILVLTTGYALVLLGIGDQVNPPLTDFGKALYFAGTSILTLGFGDIIAISLAAKLTVLSAAVTGIAVIALAVSFLFSLQSAVQKRETVVNTLEARAGAHPSGLQLLLNYAQFGLIQHLGSHFMSWEIWVAEIFESHRAFPFLAYFRSSQCCFTWITAIGALLDAANLIASSTKNVARGEALLFEVIAIKSLESLCAYLQLNIVGNYVHITRAEFALGLKMMESAGYEVKPEDQAWEAFANARIKYSGLIHALAKHFASAMPAWLESDLEGHMERLATEPMEELSLAR